MNIALEVVVGDDDNAFNERNANDSGEVKYHYCMLRLLSWNFPTIHMFHNSNNKYCGVNIRNKHIVSYFSSSSIYYY